MKGLPQIAIGVFALIILGACREQNLPPESTRYGEFDRSPRVIFQQPAAEVIHYLDQFRPLGDTGPGRERTIQVRDQDRTITALLKGGLCHELHIHGQIGDVVLPKTPQGFAIMRDSYGGKRNWKPTLNQPHTRVSADDSGSEVSELTGGRRVWETHEDYRVRADTLKTRDLPAQSQKALAKLERKAEGGEIELPANEVLVEKEVHKVVVAEVDAIWRFVEPGAKSGEYELEFRTVKSR